MERNSQNKRKLWGFLVILIVGCLGFFFVKDVIFKDKKPKWDDELSQAGAGRITYQGKQYKYNQNMLNILFMGIDSEAGVEDDNMPGDAGQSDCLMLLSLDKEKKTANIIQIPRDTMTEVDLYDTSGNYRDTINAQIATQFAYSIGGIHSCTATKKTVSELLYDLPIDGCLAMDYTNIAAVNDAIGGVEITIPKDYTMIDAQFIEGTTLRLTGMQAHDYVRYRDTDADFSNNDRMERQKQFIPALIDTIRKNMQADEEYYDTLYQLVEDYMLTDLEAEEFEELMGYELSASDIVVLPGEGKKGEVYEEFILDEEKTEKILIEMFYILVK